MASTVYDDGTLYGDADSFYGRIAAALLDAQSARIRSTGLKVSVVDERVNRWEIVNSVGAIDAGILYLGISNDPRLASYSSYRGRASVVRLDNGNIIRVRVGTHTSSTDRQLYTQTITDPTVAAQWQSWTLLYSGNHLSVHLSKTGANTYDIYHTKLAGGLYKNNSLLWATATDGELLEGIELYGLKGAGTDYSNSEFLAIQIPGTGINNRRKLDFYIMDDEASQPYPSAHNFEWYRHTMGVVKRDDNNWVALRSFPIHQDPRIEQNGESITATIVPANDFDSLGDAQAPRIVRGLAGRAGFNIITMGGADKLSDGFYYVFYYEFHKDNDLNLVQSSPFLFWQRSKDGLHWSEPVTVGFTIHGWAGLFEHDGWLYLCGNGHVIRRPMTSVVYDITNYVPQVRYEIPRGNEEGSGQVNISNPANVNANLLDLSDRRIIIEPGIRVEGGAYEFQRTGDFWIKRVSEETKNQTSRLTADIGDVWSRINQPLRDTFNIIGKTEWEDWKEDKINEAFNYYFTGGNAETTEDFKLSSSGLCLWTGWKGHNPRFSITFNTKPITLYARYVDEDNHMSFVYDTTTLTVNNVVDGASSVVDSFSIGTTSRITIDLRWRQVKIIVGSTTFTIASDDNLGAVIKPGYVGWSAVDYEVSNFVFTDWEDNINTHDIVKYSLAMGDYHDVLVSGPSEKQYAMIWGPQTDIPTAADGLRQVLEAGKLELIWRDGIIEVGQFTSEEPYRTLEDEIFETGYIDEAGRRINFAVIDGNEHSWLEADDADSRLRDRQIVAYYDLPELLTQSAVKERAQEEIRRSKKGQSPSGRIPLMLDIWRMDAIEWIDNMGRSHNIRLEGVRVTIMQNETPSQYMELDSTLL